MADPRVLKIFPRNLTARADAVVRGNPTNSRPESTVENCFPGLEIDIRNLEQHFVPGLHFEFHRDDGAILTRVALDAEQQVSGLREDDWLDAATRKPRLYLWAVRGFTTARDTESTLFGMRGQNGMEVFRRVRDLRPGRIAVVFGPVPGFNTTYPNKCLEALDAAFAATTPETRFVVSRDEAGAIQFAVFAQDRNRYLDADGVIDVDSYAPGELTKSLCAPWVYDFRDCTCFYWSSNKPDLVDSSDGQFHFLDFMRKDRTTVPPPQDVIVYAGRRDLELTYEDMIEGGWEKTLPVVLNDRESVVFVPPHAPVVTDLLTREQIVSELTYLATVEHALTVEYLFAYFSLKAPMTELPPGAPDEDVRIWTAAQQIFTIAVEEMRHLRWVNEILYILGEPTSTGRATCIGAPPEPGDGRKALIGKKYLNEKFKLQRLTKTTLQWFIDVEAPSQTANQQLDGMYVAILASLDQQRDIFPDADTLLPIVKLIIDEGGGHYERFLRVQKLLDGLPEDRYLHTLRNDPTAAEQALLDLCDQYYRSILDAIRITFSLGNRSGGVLLNAAVRSMVNLNEAAFTLTAKRLAPQFNLAEAEAKAKTTAPVFTREQAFTLIDSRSASIQSAQESVAALGSESERAMARRHRAASEQMYQQFRKIVREGFGDPQ